MLLPLDIKKSRFSHQERKGEYYATDAVRKNEEPNWKSRDKRFKKYLALMETLFWTGLTSLL